MSATMFHSKDETIASRIPISATSPLPPMRRSASLRLRGESAARLLNVLAASTPTPVKNHHERTPTSSETNPRTTTPSAATNHRQATSSRATHSRTPNGVVLKRGYSFAERGELKPRDEARCTAHSGVVNHDWSTGKIKGKTESSRGLNVPARGTGLSPRSPRHRTLSLTLSNNKINHQASPTSITVPLTTPPTSPYSPGFDGHSEWDGESISSTVSNLSLSSCDHASIAKNGTTFSGRSMKYIFHCNQHGGSTGDEYLTPTQRAHKQVRKLKNLLHQAQVELEQKDSDILKLTKEVVELRLYKAALSSPEDKSNSSSDAVTVRENTSDEHPTPDTEADETDEPNVASQVELNSSYTDSGQFDDCSESIKSKDSVISSTESPICNSKLKECCDKAVDACLVESFNSSEHDKLLVEYEKRFQELIRTHENESHDMKQKHNAKVEELLQRISDINQRYWEVVPEMEAAKSRIKELEEELESTLKKLESQEETQKQTNLEMYKQGHEAARIEREDQVMVLARQPPSRISVPELLQELQVTKNELDNVRAMYKQLMEAKNKNKIDPEITLQFLKSAIYYFLTDKENSSGHLRAIESILGFSPTEVFNINKAMLQ